MKFPIVASLILFVVFLGFRLFVIDKLDRNNSSFFLKRESAAYNTRKRALEDLLYIQIPINQLPTNIFGHNEQIRECIEKALYLRSSKIVNLGNLTNTELKLRYGAANLKTLMEYDQNFTSLICILEKWGQLLYAENLTEEATHVLEYAVSIQSDIAGTYLLLSKIYQQQGTDEKAQALKLAVNALPASSCQRISKQLASVHSLEI